MNKINRIILVINSLLVILLVFLLIKTLYEKDEKTSVTSQLSILFDFDNTDLRRIDQFIDNFNAGKADYLMLIPQPIDSGYIINDVSIEGKTVTWSVDNSRDALSVAKGMNYSCEKIEKEETNDFYNILLSNCSEFKPDEKLKVFSIDKKEL
ncbi:DUF4362 domain-containing protein [Paenibacillus piscarius]|uniref:DUF4362 domain-containing protein n=1 Tax=Paenibacillus piscarius TaxID=1089681 RepID=UPI001EE82522|nr:DUF4362 domain-containing protein [Paenibacillus piscarius]